MEFVTQLWAYKSDRFLLGVRCPEFFKNHIWILLIILKLLLVGCSLTHQLKPDFFATFFEGINASPSFMPPDYSGPHAHGSGVGQSSNAIDFGVSKDPSHFRFKPACAEDKNL